MQDKTCSYSDNLTPTAHGRHDPGFFRKGCRRTREGRRYKDIYVAYHKGEITQHTETHDRILERKDGPSGKKPRSGDEKRICVCLPQM